MLCLYLRAFFWETPIHFQRLVAAIGFASILFAAYPKNGQAVYVTYCVAETLHLSTQASR